MDITLYDIYVKSKSLINGFVGTGKINDKEQKSKISKLENDIQSKDKQIKEYKVEVDELKDLTKIAEEKARVAEQMSSKFQNDAYRVQLEKIEIENELKFFKAKR